RPGPRAWKPRPSSAPTAVRWSRPCCSFPCAAGRTARPCRRLTSRATRCEARTGSRRWEGASMGRVMLESALGRRSGRTALAAGLIPATLLLFGLGDSGTPSPAAIESAKRGRRQEERPLSRIGHGAVVVDGRIYVL